MMIFEGERELVSADGSTKIKYVEPSCTVTSFESSEFPGWEVFYRPYKTKKLTRVGLPLMFPNFSSVKDDKFTECGTFLPKHGIFCREFYDSKMTWAKVSETSDSVTIAAQYNEESLKMYPFKFRCEAKFTVQKNKLIHELKIINLESEKTLPASPGIHPYFACPQDKKKAIQLRGGCDFDCGKYDWINHCPDDNLAFDGKMDIVIPDKGTVKLSDKGGLYKRIQIWSDKSSADDHEFVCFEPVVLGADGLNNKAERLNIAPGQSAVLLIEFELAHS